MAEALVSTLLDQFASIAVREAEQEISLVVGVDTEVRKLEGNLRIILAVLDDAEKRQLKENAVKLWLKKLKDTSYEMDDVLDEWNTALIKSETEKEEEKAEDTPILKKKVCSFIPSSSCCLRKVKKLGLRHDIAHKIKELSGKIDELFKERVGYGFELNRGTEVVERIKTTSLVDESAIVGRDKEEDALVRNLLGEGSEGERSPYVISLVGMGGIGKTTLAQLAYNHPEVQAHFEKKMWVCVSDPFDQCRVAKAIIEDGGGSSNFNELQTLLKEICDLIRGKKILLVLDDVWTEETTDWEPFKLALNCGAQGSKILVTTRNERVARMVDSASIANLNKLSEDECWLIISKLAFVGRDEKQCEQLEDLGRKLANKCKGLPLAAKTLGSLMQNKKGGMNDSEGCKLGDLKNLNHLTGYLKIHGLGNVIDVQEAENAELKKKVHIHHLDLWFYEGVKENIGVKNDELVLNALEPPPYLEILKINGFKGIVYPNWIMSLTNLKSLLLNCCDNLEHFPSLGRLPFLESLKIKNADSVKKVGVEFLGIESNNKKDKGSTSSLVLFPNLKSLKFSGLEEWEEWHGMGGTREEEEECGVTIMPRLQSLTILSCPKLKTLPNFLETTPLQELIMDVYQFFSLGNAKSNNFEHLPPLGKLPLLETLKIKDADIVKKVGVEFLGIESNNKKDKGSTTSSLILFPNLKSLIFDSFREWEEWDGIGGGGVTIMPCLESLSILNCPKLKALPNFLETIPLQDLHIDARISDWMTITTSTRLKELHLYLTGCINLEHLPPVGKLPFLEYLKVKNASFTTKDGLKKVGVEFLGIESNNKKKDEGSTSSSSLVLFPNLKSLEFENLEEWEEWDGMGGTIEEGGVTIMPCLQILTIHNCPKLKSLPDFLPTIPLKNLRIFKCPILGERCRRQTGEEWSKISHIPTIQIDFFFVQVDGRNQFTEDYRTLDINPL
uniref:AAA+ ATPase domain-containing protein n=1 Tax=Fagus sylvatica TaxID=28930 RepID=A0A2N9IBB8_FAGSY